MLRHSRRQWTNIAPVEGQDFVFSVNIPKVNSLLEAMLVSSAYHINLYYVEFNINTSSTMIMRPVTWKSVQSNIEQGGGGGNIYYVI